MGAPPRAWRRHSPEDQLPAADPQETCQELLASSLRPLHHMAHIGNAAHPVLRGPNAAADITRWSL